MGGKPRPPRDEVRLEILRCHVHGYWAIAIDDRRVSPAKCCGQWDTVIRSWNVARDDVAEALARPADPPRGEL